MGPGTQPFFTMAVGGDLTVSLEGEEASFRQVDEGWLVDLRAPTGEPGSFGSISFLRNGTQPEVGTHALSDAELPDLIPSDEIGAFVVAASAAGGAFIGNAVGGTMTVSKATASTVSGSYSLTAQGNFWPPGEPPQDGEVTVAGEFVATR